MGKVNARLAKLYGAVKPEVALPVIVQTEGAVRQATLDAVPGTGAGRVSFVGEESFGTTANVDAARRLAELGGVREVFYDEPVTPVRRVQYT